MQIINFDADWLFTDLQTNDIKQLNLPHDATISTDRDPELRNYFLSAGFKGGKYSYTKTFTAPKEWADKTVIVRFDGVYNNATILLNGQALHTQAYGYVPFKVTLDGALVCGGENKLTVNIDTPETAHSRWYAGSGIYRPVSLYVGNKTHIDSYGLKITTLSHSPATIRVETTVCDGDNINPDIEITVYDNGKAICDATGQDVQITVPNAKLWSAETPYLYTVKAVLKSCGKVIDESVETFGIRTLSWSAEQGFLVNGKRTLLRGGCIHADNGVIGCVTNDVTERRRISILKSTGFNAIRSAHHPASRSLLKACDELGMYVMDEAFDTWYRMKQMKGDSLHFMRTYEDDVKAMVLNSRNHPCVVIYSIGNEIPEIGSLKAFNVAKRIVEIIKGLDDTRPLLTCPAMNTVRAYVKDTPYADVNEDEWIAQSEENKKKDFEHYIWVYTKALSNNPTKKVGEYPAECVEEDEQATNRLYAILDMAGYNYYTDKFEKLHELHPERLLVGTETRGNLIVNNWKLTKENNYIVGDFIWTLQDHLGEVNVSGINYPNGYGGRNYPWLTDGDGIVDLTGHILPSINRFKFAWGGHKGLYLASQPPLFNGDEPQFNSYSWTDTIDGWTYDGMDGHKTFIDVYTDAYEAEVLINGKSLGRKKPTEYFVKFPAVYESGEVVGIGYDANGKEIYRESMRTAGKETVLTVNANKTTLQASGEDFVYIDIAVTDNNGVVKSKPERIVKVDVTGAGVLQGLGSANPVNAEKFTTNNHTTYNGRLLAVVRSTTSVGQITVKIMSDGLTEKIIYLNSEKENTK